VRRSRILIVDDSVVARRMVATMIESDPSLELAGYASSGRIALDRLDDLRPDLVVLDVEMPEPDGIETLRQLRRRAPDLPVVMFSSLTERAAEITLDALAHGAADYVTKPSSLGGSATSFDRVREMLLAKIHTLVAPAHVSAPIASPAARSDTTPPWTAAPPATGAPRSTPVELVVVGASTGGPNALEEIFAAIPATFAAPIVVVQHMPPLFTRLMAERLDARSPLRVGEVRAGARPLPGEAWIAPGDFHAVVDRDARGLVLGLHRGEPEHFCRPAVDVLFRSAARSAGAGVLGVVLTGMGCDGLAGSHAIIEAGGAVVAQDRRTSMVFGMPGAVVAAGIAGEIVALGDVASALVRRVSRPKNAAVAHPARPIPGT
jgi:two-component system chemotaxis response regulator CheB